MRSGRKPQPPKHGQIKVGGPTRMKHSHMRKHLEELTASAAEVRDYGGHEAIADSRGQFAPGGAAGADYQTNSVNDNPDPDFSGTSR